LIKLIINSYLIGSIPFAYIFARKWANVDLREKGSRNVGTTSVFQQAGVLPGVMTAVCDAGKGIVAALLGSSTLAVGGGILGLVFAIVGHNWPIWLGFHGGGGLATFIGGMLVLSEWWVILVLLAIWGLLYLVVKNHDRSACIACSVAPFVLGLLHSSWTHFFLGLGSSFVIGIKRVASLWHKKKLKNQQEQQERQEQQGPQGPPGPKAPQGTVQVLDARHA